MQQDSWREQAAHSDLPAAYTPWADTLPLGVKAPGIQLPQKVILLQPGDPPNCEPYVHGSFSLSPPLLGQVLNISAVKHDSIEGNNIAAYIAEFTLGPSKALREFVPNMAELATTPTNLMKANAR
uniref:Uncharacterized protein n=1 Tax=Timema genevievae TaxID=629358 RepID=A0A7R9PSJ2_TIMGE|nr:unnamed protein product [Timema genevievae]